MYSLKIGKDTRRVKLEIKLKYSTNNPHKNPNLAVFTNLFFRGWQSLLTAS